MNVIGHPLNAPSAWNQSIHFTPLVGPDYDAGLVDGIRVLLLGESHYGIDDAGGNFGSRCTHHHFEGYLTDDCDWSTDRPFFQKLPSIVTRKLEPTAAESGWAWRHIAFSNAIQSLLPASSAVPTREQFERAGEAVQELVSVLRPHVVLMLGKRLWDGIPPAIGVYSDEPPIQPSEQPRKIWLLPHPDGFSRATWIYHPSRYFESIPSSIAVFSELLERAHQGQPRPIAG